ncbi:unnamed protein product [Pleuronectes platessa]|uniref:Uncharacterized protein n=1 Tax=Pleuronectes platessa TaxID=8262 RepID=A0A9N7V2B0_PLEPL|nr:unnamed protein product [Pleuronectes platessa]
MDNKSKKRPGGAEKHREKKLKSLEVEAATCGKLTDLFGAGFTSPAAAGAPGDERGGLDNDERVEADMRARVRQNQELPGDEAHEKFAKLQPQDESYCDTDEEMWQPEDGEEEDDWGEDTQQSEDGEVEDDSDEDTQQPEDCEEDSETLSTRKILIETDLHSYYKELQEAYVIKQQLFASELQFERSKNKVLLDELEKLKASNNELSQRYEAENLRAGQQASHLMALIEQDESQMHSFHAEQNFLRLQIMEEMRCLRNSAAEEKMLLQRQVEELTSQLSLMKEREDVKHQEWQEERDEEKQEEKWGELQEAYIIKQQMFASELQFERSTVKALLDELDKLRASQLSLKNEREDINHQEWQEERDEEKQEKKLGELQEASIIKQQMFASELQFERSTVKALLDELDKLKASNNEIIQRAEADNLRAGQQASHLMAELEKVTSQMNSFQAEQNLLHLQITEEMRCLRKSAAEEKMLLQREVEELTSQLSLKKEREDIKHQEWQEERDEEKQEVKWEEEQQEKEEEKWGEEAGGGEPVDKPAYLESHSDALPASEPVETELSEETPKKKKSSIWKKIRQHLGLRRRKKQPHN